MKKAWRRKITPRHLSMIIADLKMEETLILPTEEVGSL
jgi:hypothetical protein